MSIERVKAYFRAYGLEENIQEFEVSSATVQLAAEALHCEPQRIAKTLSFMINGNAVLVVMAGDAKMLSPEEVERMVGHAVGGVCPFAVNKDVKVYLDISLKRFETVFPACGSSNSAIELTIPELQQYSRPVDWVDVCKNWE